nr:hypothetical protein [Actinoplanes missouriensis]
MITGGDDPDPVAEKQPGGGGRDQVVVTTPYPGEERAEPVRQVQIRDGDAHQRGSGDGDAAEVEGAAVQGQRGPGVDPDQDQVGDQRADTDAHEEDGGDTERDAADPDTAEQMPEAEDEHAQ